MRIIILAAGKGTRAFPLTKNTPKPLLDIGNGVTLLEKQLENIQKSKAVDEVILVIGYLAEQIEVKLRMHEENGLKVTTVYNPFYEMSNNLISLWLSKHCNDDDMKVILRDKTVARVSKEIPNNEASCESVGLVMVKGSKYREIFKRNLEALARNRNYINKFWLEVFNLMKSHGIAIKTFKIDGKTKWREVDFHLDLDDAKKLLNLSS